MYSVAVHTNEINESYSMTVRDFARSTHWRPVDTVNSMQDPIMMRDTREDDYKPFTVIAQFDNETDARKFSAVIESAYALAGWTRETVKITT